jgi:hypothetical protein
MDTENKGRSYQEDHVNADHATALQHEDHQTTSTDDTTRLSHDDNEVSREEVDTEQSVKPVGKKSMTFKAKLCLYTSISLVLFTAMYAVGGFSNGALLVGYLYQDHPIILCVVTFFTTVAVSAIIEHMLPSKFSPLAVLPLGAVSTFWLACGWMALAQKEGSLLEFSGVALIALASASVGICVAVHDEEASVYRKVSHFIWYSHFANLAAIAICALLIAFVPTEKDYSRAVADDTYPVRKAYSLMGECRAFKATDFCDALELIENDLAKYR